MTWPSSSARIDDRAPCSTPARPDPRLAAHVLGAHVDDAFEPEAGANGGSCDTMLPGARLGDDAPLAEPLCQHRLSERVVQLVRTGVEEVFALEVDPLAGGVALGEGE